ncbi:dienelactone hydrolase family protein [Aurantiacibacter rhizosphaerae]|uniref:Dienelactone hydrolase domain-containing protein n=1 Tax=Aurantiacibacter rhizosphaerae TaxID=2691582 RepID=A0A844XEM4_9SPHN|nr:dienelactone hydrolase family protein [Aurantiacibacter rhizosphaerae]MWV28028.1 hypothetical protein [Aurantiacibacter rhizosphaerae]
MIGRVAAVAVIGLASACAPGGEIGDRMMTSHPSADQHYYPSATDGEGQGNPWIVILPGGGGIEVFGDTEFYFDVARHWNSRGLDALVVHYQEAAPILGIESEGIPGPMEAKVVRDALASAEREGWLDLQCPGFVIGFSAGGSGVLSLVNDPVPNLVGAIGYYPLVLGQPEDFTAQVPMLVLQGEADDLTTPEALDSFLQTATPQENFIVHRYEGAEHGFDIPSLAKPVEYNGGVFLYEEEAAKAAGREANAFVAHLLADRGTPDCGGS